MKRNAPAAALAISVVVALASACQPPAAELTDPREILAGTVAATAGLRTFSMRVDVQSRDTGQPAMGMLGGALEADVDLAARKLAARAVGTDGREAVRVILADGRLFSASDGGARWQQAPLEEGWVGGNPVSTLLFGGGPGTAAPDYVQILIAAARASGGAATLSGVEDCESGRCYRTGVEIPREAIWPLMVQLGGLDQVPGIAGMPPPPLDQLPTVALTALTDTTTLRLVVLEGIGTLGTTTVQIRIGISNPNGAVNIEAPPPNLVDPPPDIDGILDSVGEEVEGGGMAPAPAPAAPTPPSP